MSQLQELTGWEGETKEKFTRMIERMPLFHREIARTVVAKKAQENARERRSSLVEESDVVKAFFTEVPKPFYSLMIRLLDEVDFNYSEVDVS